MGVKGAHLMKDISEKELHGRFLATQGKFAHLKTKSSKRRHTWGDIDFHAIGDPFVRDLSVILSSKAYRRMGGKNQVASSSLAPHIRNRGTHVVEVQAHSTRLADHLGLNVGLAGSISAGHDIGHVPFGHQGEHWLKKRTGLDITHEVLGVIIAQHVERRGVGLNLTHATLDGMYRHSGSNASPSMTAEAWVVRYADKFAYLFADYNDFTRMDWPVPKDLMALMEWFGKNQRDRTFRVMMALCEESVAAGRITFEESEPAKRFAELRRLMYKEYGRVVEQDVSRFLEPIYGILERSEHIPPWLGIALLTDEEVCRLASEHHMLCWKGIMGTGLGEIIKTHDRDHMFSIDPLKLDLDW